MIFCNPFKILNLKVKFHEILVMKVTDISYKVLVFTKVTDILCSSPGVFFDHNSTGLPNDSLCQVRAIIVTKGEFQDLSEYHL